MGKDRGLDYFCLLGREQQQDLLHDQLQSGAVLLAEVHTCPVG